MSEQNPVESIPEPTNDPIDDSPTFTPVKRIKHLTFAPKPIEIPDYKPKAKGKKKKKKASAVKKQEGDEPKEKTITFQEVKKKKKTSKHKKEKSTEDTPKFGDKAMKLSNMSNFSEALGGSTMIVDAENNKGETLDPDAVTLTLPKNEKYKEDIMLGLNVTSYLRSKHIPILNKIFYATFILIFATSCILNLWDLILYARTTCPYGYSPIPMYIDFIILLVAKFGIFNYFTSEVNANLAYDLKFPFIIPILSTGVVANLQLPLVLYDYHTCHMRSELLQLSFGYFVVDAAAVLVALGFFSIIVSLIFLQKLRLSHETMKMIKTIFYFIGISLMLLLNGLFMFVSFTQTKSLSLTLITENITYWSLVISGTIIFVLRKRCNIVVFRSLPEFDEEKPEEKVPEFAKPPEIIVHQAPASVASDEPHHVAIGIPLEVPPHLKNSTLHIHRQPLEQIEENSYENETDNSPTMTGFPAKKAGKDDGQTSVSENPDFTINCIQVPKTDVIEEEEEGEQNNADIEKGI